MLGLVVKGWSPLEQSVVEPMYYWYVCSCFRGICILCPILPHVRAFPCKVYFVFLYLFEFCFKNFHQSRKVLGWGGDVIET